MEKESSSSSPLSSAVSASCYSPGEIDWSQISSPLPTILFDKYTHQSILPPLSSLNLSLSQWENLRSLALNLASKGFIDPVSIVYTSFKRWYPLCSSIRSFVRWLTLYEKTDPSDLKNFIKDYSHHITPIQSVGELVRHVQSFEDVQSIPSIFDDIEQVWIVCSMSIRLPNQGSQLISDVIHFDESATHLPVRSKRTSGTSRMICLFAVTPSGRYSNQLIVVKQNRNLKINVQSTKFTRIISTTTGDVHPEYLQQWLEDFVALNGTNERCAMLMDPRTTLFNEEFVDSCQKSNLNLLTIDLKSYLTHILSPLFSLMDKQWTELNRLEQMLMKSSSDLQRLIHSIWFILRNFKLNEDICRLFQSSSVWKKSDETFLDSLRTPCRTTTNLPKRKKKKISAIKSGEKNERTNVSKGNSTALIIDPPSDSSAEEIFNYIAQRQLSTARASRCLGGMKLDYLKYIFSSKSNSANLTGEELLRLNTLMQSSSTVDWLKELRSTYFWPCAKQIFLREIFLLSKIITRTKKMDMCGHGNLGSSRNCDLQAPSTFWKSFEDLHQIQFENEPIANQDQWHEHFQTYLSDHHLDNSTTQLWTLDTFEFPLVKKSTVLQLPEWNETRPMNLTPKVTVIYAFSSTGRSIDPVFIFPQTFRQELHDDPSKDFYNDLGHLTAPTFLSWIDEYFVHQIDSPIALVFCSRLPILSPSVLSKLKQFDIYPYGYPSQRTLPFRYLFERRVRNNRSTNLMSELWKKKLLDEQRTHVLKGSACSIKTIKYYFQQIWSQLLHEKQDEDDDHQTSEPKTWSDLCQQAFQQANIEVKISTKNKRIKQSVQIDPLIEQLNQLIDVIHQMKEKTNSASSSQILRINNQIEENSQDLMELSSTLNETMDNVENVHPPSGPTGDKRSMDDQDESHLSKRLRSSCPTTTVQPVIPWVPPSKQLVTHLHHQSSSLFQFILSLIQTIILTADQMLTAEHLRWLHATVDHYEDESNFDKINLTIETAYKVVKIDFVR